MLLIPISTGHCYRLTMMGLIRLERVANCEVSKAKARQLEVYPNLMSETPPIAVRIEFVSPYIDTSSYGS